MCSVIQLLHCIECLCVELLNFVRQNNSLFSNSIVWHNVAPPSPTIWMFSFINCSQPLWMRTGYCNSLGILFTHIQWATNNQHCNCACLIFVAGMESYATLVLHPFDNSFYAVYHLHTDKMSILYSSVKCFDKSTRYINVYLDNKTRTYFIQINFDHFAWFCLAFLNWKDIFIKSFAGNNGFNRQNR